MKQITLLFAMFLSTLTFAQTPDIWLDFENEIIPSFFSGIENIDEAGTPNALVTDPDRGKVLDVASLGYLKVNESALNKNSFTIAYWYKWLNPTVWWVGHATITGNNNVFVRPIHTQKNGNNAGASLQNWGSNTPEIFKNNTWHHVALTYDSGTATVILDGVEVSSGSAGFNPNSISDFALNFGVKLDSNGSGNPYSFNTGKCPNSLFDNFMVFDNALSVSDVNNVMAYDTYNVAPAVPVNIWVIFAIFSGIAGLIIIRRRFF